VGQVRKWPVNPVRIIAALLKKRNDRQLVVVDFGCGDAQLSLSVGGQHKVHSFDLVAANDRVTACDMAHVPLEAKVADVAVFCLSLMGTNLGDFVAEAHRVLRDGGDLIIAEVKSRFEQPRELPGYSDSAVNATNTAAEDDSSDGGVRGFVKAMRKMGFKLKKKDMRNKMFVLLRFKKTRSKHSSPVFDWTFKPCVYKKR